MKTAWILGSRGFVGRHVARHLAKSGVKVIGIGHGTWSQTAAEHWGLAAWHETEITRSALCQVAHAHGAPDTIIHLAGGSLVSASVNFPLDDFMRSVPPTVEVLEWMRVFASKVPLVFASSAAVYGDKHLIPISEDSQLSPCSPYGYHKQISELVIQSYSTRFGISSAIVRLFSVYGIELQKQLLWDLCTRCRQNPSAIRLHGTGRESRDWLWVEDAASYLSAAVTLASKEPFVVNGGTGSVVSVSQIAEAVLEAWGLTCPIEYTHESRPGDPSFLVADVTRAITFGLAAKTNWREGVGQYVKWFKKAAGSP